MKPYQPAQPRASTTRLVEGNRLLPLCLVAIGLGACSVDLSKLQGSKVPVPDGSADLRMASDATVTRTDVDGSGVSVAADSPVSPDLPDTEDVAVFDDLDVLPDPDAPAPDGTADRLDLPRSDEGAEDALSDDGASGGNGGNGGSGAGGADTNGSGGAGGGVGDVNASGGSGGAGGSGGMVEVDAVATGGTGGLDAGDVPLDTDAVVYDGTDGVAVEAGGTGGTGGADPDLVLWYKFDESSGTVVSDSSSSSGGHDGTLGTAGIGGGATFSTSSQVGTHALSLVSPTSSNPPSGGYVTVPAPEALAPGAVTIAIWVRLAAATSSQNWERIYDFGSGPTAIAFFYLTARASDATNSPVRFGLSNSGHTAAAEQRLENTSALTANVWYHIAVVLPAGVPYTGTLYIDGVPVATNNAMTVHMSNIGTTTQNWIGRSPFSADPYFYGSLDDFRIYKRALSAAEISALFALR